MPNPVPTTQPNPRIVFVDDDMHHTDAPFGHAKQAIECLHSFCDPVVVIAGMTPQGAYATFVGHHTTGIIKENDALVLDIAWGTRDDRSGIEFYRMLEQHLGRERPWGGLVVCSQLLTHHDGSSKPVNHEGAAIQAANGWVTLTDRDLLAFIQRTGAHVAPKNNNAALRAAVLAATHDTRRRVNPSH